MISPSRTVSVKEVAAHYDELDPFYRDIWGEHVHHGLWKRGARISAEEAVQNLATHVARAAGLSKDAGSASVCDIGCGYGATARMLATEFGADVTGITISEAQYGYAFSVQRGATNPRFILGDWLENDLATGAFQHAIAIESIAHVADKRAFLAEALRVLRPGGTFVMCAWLAGSDPSRFARQHLLEPICSEGRLPGIGSSAEYRQLMEEVGFSVDSVEDLTDAVRRTWSICLRRMIGNTLRRPEYRRFLFDRRQSNRVFAITAARIWLAYRLGEMRYGLFVGRRPR